MNILSVSQLNRYVKSLLESNPLLGEVYVRGEISSLSAHTASGHLYFSLKEGGVSVRAVMFRGHASHLRFRPENGLAVLVRGQATLYERDGAFQLYISDMQLDGLGAMYAAYEKLKARLSNEGLFNPEHKRPLPPLPTGVGVVTSKSGAALQDILKVLSRRYPIGRVVLAPAYVQGDKAAGSLIAGLQALEADPRCDVIILGRGGGSMEDLWAFNEEALVRAVADCKKPVISAVGHETDFTLCDFAADLRAPTPSAAAELATPDLSDLPEQLKATQRRMAGLLNERLRRYKTELTRLAASPALRNGEGLTAPYRRQLQESKLRLGRAYREQIRQKRQALLPQIVALDMASPLKTLARGYTLTTDAQGRPLTGPPEAGESLSTRYHWGTTLSIVSESEVYHAEKTQL